MGLRMNGKEMKSVKYNGKEFTKFRFNGKDFESAFVQLPYLYNYGEIAFIKAGMLQPGKPFVPPVENITKYISYDLLEIFGTEDKIDWSEVSLLEVSIEHREGSNSHIAEVLQIPADTLSVLNNDVQVDTNSVNISPTTHDCHHGTPPYNCGVFGSGTCGGTYSNYIKIKRTNTTIEITIHAQGQKQIDGGNCDISHCSSQECPYYSSVEVKSITIS